MGVFVLTVQQSGLNKRRDALYVDRLTALLLTIYRKLVKLLALGQ